MFGTIEVLFRSVKQDLRESEHRTTWRTDIDVEFVKGCNTCAMHMCHSIATHFRAQYLDLQCSLYASCLQSTYRDNCGKLIGQVISKFKWQTVPIIFSSGTSTVTAVSRNCWVRVQGNVISGFQIHRLKLCIQNIEEETEHVQIVFTFEILWNLYHLSPLHQSNNQPRRSQRMKSSGKSNGRHKERDMQY